MSSKSLVVVLLCLAYVAQGCEDTNPSCGSWSMYCNTGNNYMKIHCKKTCGQCGGTVSGWSVCSKTCGIGTQHKAGKTQWQACNIQDCPVATCSSGTEQRDGIPHSCCTKQPRPPPCGQRYLTSQKIFSGSSAIAKKHPWIAAISATIPGKPAIVYCAGTLISAYHVITAAHCLADINTGKQHRKDYIKLKFGALRLTDNGLTMNVDRIYFHDLQSPKGPDVVFDYPKHDIAIIKMSSAVRLSSVIHPICLPGYRENTPTDTAGFVAGWGISTPEGTVGKNHLQEAALQNLDMGVCRELFDKHESLIKLEAAYAKTSDKLLCAGYIHKKVNSCRGDSGGPLVFQSCSSCTFYLGGIVSFGHPDCSAEVPGAYTKIKSYVNWINGIVSASPTDGYCQNTVGP